MDYPIAITHVGNKTMNNQRKKSLIEIVHLI